MKKKIADREKKTEVIEEGDLVNIIPPRRKTPDIKGYGTWLVKDIFLNRGKYPTLPHGKTARLTRPWRDDWILPVANLVLTDDVESYYKDS
ncbi:MAG: hypothetical protein WCT16_03815 [Candidatus Buchananbacteria bacterium]